MKAKKLTALILSILMVISVMPTTIFALPSGVIVTDSFAKNSVSMHSAF